jgi:MFS family permease
MATSITIAVTSLAAVQLAGGNEAIAGIPSALGLAGRAAFAFPLGWFMDRAGRRPGLAIGYLAGAVGALMGILALWWASLFFFLVAMTVIGMGRAASDQSRFVAAEVHVASRRARAIGLVVFAGTVGALGAPPLVSLSSQAARALGQSEYVGTLLAAGLLTAFASLVSFIFLRPEPQTLGKILLARERAAAPADAPILDRSMREIFSDSRVQLALVAMLIGQAVMVLLMVIIPLHMAHHDHDLGSISWVLLAHTLGMFGLSSFTGSLIDRFGRMQMIMVGALILIVASLVSPISTDIPMLALSMFLIGLGWNYCFIAGSSLFADATSSAKRGRAQGLGEAISSTASGGASLLAGVIFGLGDFVWVAITGFGLSAILAAVFLIVLWRNRTPASLIPVSTT